MKLFKKLFNAAIIFLIVILIAGIIYVLQFKEEPRVIEEQKKETKTIETKKTVKSKIKESNLLIPKPVHKRQIAIIIDDIGYDLNAIKELQKIDADLTFAILPFQAHSREAAEIFHKAKREILLHVPMEPVSYPREKPGEGALFTDMNDEEIVLQLKKNISAVPYISGVNNHMGSKLMMDKEKLAVIFYELKKNKLFFIDSRTSADTNAVAVADKVGLRIAERKIFLDNDSDYKKIFNNLINIAKNDNIYSVIAIGHPHPETIRAIKDATKILRDNGVSIVPVSQIIKGKKS